MMNEDDYNDEFKEKMKEIFKTNVNTIPYHLLDLSFKTTMTEIAYNVLAIKSTIGNLLLTVLNNIDYINILLKEGFVNYSLNKGNFKITDFKNSYGVEDETDDIITLITRMEFEILDNYNRSIISGNISCAYNKEIKDGQLIILMDESISDKYIADSDLYETYFETDNISDRYNIIDKVSSINKNGIELKHTIYEIIGDIYDYTDTRSVFIIDNKE